MEFLDSDKGMRENVINAMAKLAVLVLVPVLVLYFLIFVPTGHGDLGTASLLSPPYLPNACGFDPSQFPSDNMFAAAGEGLWDNGAACGRQYLVRCTSAAAPGACIPDKTIKVTIVDDALTLASQMVISRTGYNAIATSSPESINIDFKLFS